jgi:hypothetical protein
LEYEGEGGLEEFPDKVVGVSSWSPSCKVGE